MYKYFVIFFLFHIASSVDKGPVGLRVYRNLNRIPELHTGVRTRQFSSYDRKGGNDDGGHYSCLKMTNNNDNNRCVIAERMGPGELDSLWFTRDNGVVIKTGKIDIELDGKIVVSHLLQDIVNGKTDLPFVWPLVGNGDDTSGGVVIKVPMQFKKSMRIVTDTNPGYYHVTYRTFANDKGVHPYDPKEISLDIVNVNREFGIRDPKLLESDDIVKYDHLNITGDAKLVIKGKTSGEIREIKIHMPQLVRSPRVVDDFRAFGAKGWSRFEAKIDHDADHCRVTRRLDPHIGNQIALLLVNQMSVGEWNSHNAINRNEWAEETIEIPAHLTKNKSQIEIRNEFRSSSFDFNEFRYDIHCLVKGEWIRTDIFDVGPNHPGDERAHLYENFAETAKGNRVFRYHEDPAKLKMSDDLLAETRIQISFDDQKTVDAPIGEFFGTGLGMYNVRSLMMSVDAQTNVFTCWWPMPFQEKVELKLFNPNVKTLNNISVHFRVHYDETIKERLRSEQYGYFHGTYNKAETVNGKDYIFLNASGHGVFYGVSHTMRGLIKSGNLRDYLEGDERVFVDGLHTPVMLGTGTEDFYESGWYFRNGITYNMPLAGNPAYETAGDGCEYDCTGAFRLFIPEAINFLSSIVFGIEHGPVNNEPAIYSSVAYWYGQRNPLLKMTDTINVTDNSVRSAHHYSAENEEKSHLQSVFEGPYDKVQVSGDVTSASGNITFGVTIDPKNIGVRIFRTGDQKVSFQCVNVYADGASVGVWLQPLGNEWQRWLNDDFDIPEHITKGKKKITLTLVPVSHDGGPKLWSASKYDIMSIMENN